MITLKYAVELSDHDIALILELSESRVKRLLQEALIQLETFATLDAIFLADRNELLLKKYEAG